MKTIILYPGLFKLFLQVVYYKFTKGYGRMHLVPHLASFWLLILGESMVNSKK